METVLKWLDGKGYFSVCMKKNKERIVPEVVICGAARTPIGYKLMGEVMRFLTQVSRGRSRNVFILNAPTTFSVLWKMA